MSADFDASDERAQLGRPLPQDLAAEQSVLGAMMMSKDAIADVVEVVKGQDFYRPAHELIFDAIIELYGRGEPADPITVSDQLGKTGELTRAGGQIYLADLLASVAIAANAGYYAEIVHEKAVLRRLIEASIKIAQLGYQGTGDVAAIVDAAEKAIYDVSEGRTAEDYKPLSVLIEPTIDEMEAIESRSGMSGVPTGFEELDDLTNGLHGGQMIIIAARPAVGKSTLALDFARSAAIKNKLTTAFFSLEMSRTEIVMRLLSAEAQVTLNHIRNGKMTDDDWARVVAKTTQVSEAPLFIDDSPNLTMMEIRAKARRLRQRHDLRLVVIDYMQLMTSGKKVESRQLEVSEFSRQIKLLAKELEIPVIALSQLNRGPEQRTDKKPMLSDLRESGCLTADTRVLRADTGVDVSMGELLSSGATEVPVWGLSDDQSLVARAMTHVFSSGVKEIFQLQTASGRVIKASGNHPFRTRDGWTPLSELAAKIEIAIPRSVPEPLRPVRLDAVALQRCAANAAHKIPDALLSAPTDQVAEFLGMTTFGGRGPGWEFVASTRRAAERFVLLMARVGQVGRISQTKRGYEVSAIASSSDSISGDVFWDPIVRIDSLGSEEVFDATVRDVHNFVANGVVVHNSLEQDADMVILLHREDVYDRESNRAGEADLIVAKHRNGPTATVTTVFQGHYSRFVDMQR